jgi:hypothetical protein
MNDGFKKGEGALASDPNDFIVHGSSFIVR